MKRRLNLLWNWHIFPVSILHCNSHQSLSSLFYRMENVWTLCCIFAFNIFILKATEAYLRADFDIPFSQRKGTCKIRIIHTWLLWLKTVPARFFQGLLEAPWRIHSICVDRLYKVYWELPLTRGYCLYIGSCPSRGATDSILGAAPHEGLLTLYWELPLTRDCWLYIGSCPLRLYMTRSRTAL